jgi:CRP/FNR family cyclic AMP-dependent transcriptional regulator
MSHPFGTFNTPTGSGASPRLGGRGTHDERRGPWRTTAETLVDSDVDVKNERSPASAHLRIEQLREIGLFGGLSDGVLTAMLDGLTVGRVGADEAVFDEGERAREMYVVIDGALALNKRSASGAESRIATVGPGDWTGEMSILDVMPRSCSARATRDSLLLVLSAKDLDRLYRADLGAYAMFVMNLARELSRRLRRADAIVADVAAALGANAPRDEEPSR